MTNLQTTGTEQGDINAGLLNNGSYGTPAKPVSSSNPISNANSNPTTSNPTTTPNPVGMDDTSFLGVLNGLNNGLQQNNSLVTQKNLIQKQMFDQPLSSDEINQLPPDVRAIVQGGNRDQMALQLQIINDSLQGRNNSVAASIGFLTTGYEQAQTRYNSDVTNVLNYAKALNAKPSDVMKALYPAEAARLGTSLDTLAAPLLTTTQVQPVTSTFGITPTPGSAAAVNNVSGMKSPGGSFIAYSSPTDSFNATVSDIQGKIDGTSSTGLNSNSTLQDFVNTWINGPGGIGGTANQGYTADDVSNFLNTHGMSGISATTPIGQLDATSLATAIANFETGYGQATKAPGTTGSSQMNSSAKGYYTAIVPGTGGQTQAQIDQAALLYASSGTLPAAGRSTTGAGLQISNSIKARASELNTGGNIASNKATLTALSSSLTSQVDYANNITRSLQTVDDNIKILEEAANNVNSSSSPIVNQVTNSVKSNITGSGLLNAYQTALQTVRTEYATILGRGTPTDQTRTEATTLIPNNISKDQLMNVIQVVNQEGQNIMTDANKSVQRVQNQINGIVTNSSGSSSGSSGSDGSGSSSSTDSITQEVQNIRDNKSSYSFKKREDIINALISQNVDPATAKSIVIKIIPDNTPNW